jgi:pimeloyl-ACP methyl ester carboxylesterase
MTEHDVRQGAIAANGIEFAYLEAGEGPLALCLHGFPDSAQTWRYLLPALAGAGYRAVAPWMRGYAPTAVPADGRYQSGALALDAIELHAALGGDERAVIVGHDWGAIATYAATGYAPDRWRKAVTAAVPPLAVAGGGLMQYRQLRKSWYFFFFQHALSDMVVGANDLEFIEQLWADWSPGYDGAEDLVHVKAALRDPANLAAAIAYYRAMLGDGLRDPELEPIDAAAAAASTVPTLYLHGDQDGCMGVELAEQAGPFLPPEGSRVEIVKGAGHFLHVEKPEEVNALILDHLGPA